MPDLPPRPPGEPSSDKAENDGLEGLPELGKWVAKGWHSFRSRWHSFSTTRHAEPDAATNWWHGWRDEFRRVIWFARLRRLGRSLRGEWAGWPSARRIGSVAAVILLGWFIGFLIGKLNPIGAERTSGTYSAALVNRMTAPFYDGTAQEHIAVVLIDQSTLQQRGISWPPRYGYYEEVLRRVLRYQPRAVFFDVLLSEPRAYDDSLQDAREAIADDLRDTSVPVLFSQAEPGSATLFGSVPGISTAVAGWRQMQDRYPLRVTSTTALAPFAAKPTDALLCHGEAASDTVALRLYDLACRAGEAGCAEPSGRLNAHRRCAAMSVVWGRRPPSQMREDPNAMAPCAADSGRLWQAISGLGRTVMAGLFPSLADDALQPCPYTLTLQEQELDDRKVGALLHDRVVLVGVNLVGMDDSVISPVHGRLPGVYLHAMALDNLMTYGHRFYSGGGGFLEQLAAALVLSLFLAWMLWRRPHGMFGWMLIGALLFVMVWWFVMGHLLRHPPINWLWLLGIFVFVVERVRRQRRRCEPPGANT